MIEKSDWPAASVEMRPLSDLVPYANNSRIHSDEQIAQIAAAMQEWGWTNPILVDEAGMILAGHGRVLAAEKLELAEVPVMIARGWSELQKQAYIVADNKLAQNAGWDMAKLAVELGDLQGAGFDLALMGFSAAELAGLSNSPAPPEPQTATLAERFGVVPFSVLNAREGWWQERKAAWLSLGIESEIGRGENLLKFSDTINQPDPAKRAEKAKIVAGKGWADGGPARRDPAFYAKKREWEKANGKKISTPEFREKHWDGYAHA